MSDDIADRPVVQARPRLDPATRLAVLAEASRAFAESDIDIETTLATITRLISRTIGDGCSVRLLDDAGEWFTGSVVFHPDPLIREGVEAIGEDFPQRSDEGLFGRALASGQVNRWTAGAVEPAESGMKPEHARFVEQHGFRDLLIAPLQTHERSLGVLLVWRDMTDIPYGDDDVELLRELAAPAAISLDHARLFRAASDAEQQYRLLFDAIPEAAWVFDLETLRFLAANQTAVARLGYTRDEFLSMRLPDIRLPEDVPLLMQRLAEMPEQGPFSLSVRHVRKDGSIVLSDLMSHPIRFQGRAARLVISVDVTERRKAEERLREAEARYRMLVEQMPGVVYLQTFGDSSGVSFVSRAVEAMLGYTPEECTSNPEHWVQILHPDDRERVLLEHEQAIAARRRLVTEYRNVARDGRVVWVRDEIVPVIDDDGRVTGWHGVMVDITEQREVEDALRRNEQRFESLIHNVSDIIGVIDHEARLLYVSPAIERVLGYPVRVGPDLSIETIVHPDDQGKVKAVIAELARRPRAQQATEFRVRRAGGDWRLLSAHLTNMLDDPSVNGIIIVCRDITERQQFQARLEHQAFYDDLTGLPNRALFFDRLRHALARSEREPAPFAVLFLDVDDFKVVNDSLGHPVGDHLLTALARRLEGLVRPADTVARLGGDEFAFLLEDIAAEHPAEVVAERILDALREPLTLVGRAHYVAASIGIVVSRGSSDSPETLLRDADIALYQAKARGKACHVVFHAGMRLQALDRLDLESDLRRAIEHDQLVVHYQPVVALAKRVPVAYEALLRWQRPRRGLVLPGEFLRVAEETGLILPIGEWLLRSACRQLRAWRDAGPEMARVGIGVNLSARQFATPDLIELVETTLAENGLHPDSLTLEVGETTMMDDVEATVETLQALRRIGVRLTIDAFGAGYSSLAHLKRFPADYLKIDRSFVSGLTADAPDTRLLSGMIAIARALDLKVIAVGVETAGQHEQLLALGCDLGQGFYYQHPQPAGLIRALPPGGELVAG